MDIVDVSYIGSNDDYQSYNASDLALINKVTINANYGGANDYIEYFIKDQSGIVLSSNYYGTQYNIGSVVNSTNGQTSQLFLDPETDARNAGYDRGIVDVKYNFFTKQLLSGPDPSINFWIKQISSTRTEIQVARQDLSNTELANTFNNFNNVLAGDAYYPDFYLNFGNDVQLIAINAVYIEDVNGNGTIIFKLYEPLPSQFDLKSTFWVVTAIADSAEFNVSINAIPETVSDSQRIKGPNYKVTVKDRIGHTTPYYNYTNLILTALTSSYQQVQSMMQEQGLSINVDYSSFDNFIHFSSITNRLYNFTYKQQLIESASAGIAAGQTTTAALLLQQQINTIIANYDGYEYYLTFSSASTAWPKQNNTPPYIQYSVTSSQVTNWLGSLSTTPNGPATMSMYWSSSYYDDQNKDLLIHATPSYIRDDSNNTPYLTFLNMIGQMFDNIWIYLKDVTTHYAANNSPFVGVSMDIVADALRSMGIQLYTNTSISDNLYYSLLGVNQTGSSLPVTSSLYSTIVYASSSFYPLAGQPYLSASLLLPPFGNEKINRYVTTFVTGSPNVTQSFQTLPNDQITGEIYKRIYHNLPYLLKSRGTHRGLQALVTAYGIPPDILSVNEYGGYNIYTTPGIQEIATAGMIITGSFQQVSASLLSPNVTLQYYNNNLQRTSIDVEVAFSPADSINANITSSGLITSSTQPGYFNIMQYIGDPALQYSSSYVPLVTLGNAYFNANYTTGYDVWDFIRLIKYYNNSLFKMLRDFVPARASADTGIVIKSHMLERNKYSRHEPTYTTSSYDAEYILVTVTGSNGGSVSGSTAYIASIPIQYNGTASMYFTQSLGTVFVSSSNNIQQYTGEFSGSYIKADKSYFNQKDVSNYYFPWTSSVAPSLNGGQNVMFLTYSLSPLFENVFSPVRSQRFLELDYNSNQIAPVNYGLVTQSLSQSAIIGNLSQSLQPYSQYSYVQDFNYHSNPSVKLKYSGSKLSGLYYNIFTAGDTSFNSEPVINWYSSKLGYFTQLQTSSFIPGVVNATLAYLADVSGGLYELNQNNKNWIDIQNTFKAGTTLTVKQFNNRQFSNQVSTDGVKTIYNSGYNYTPQLYFLSGSDINIWFQYLGTNTGLGSGFTAINGGNSGTNYYIGNSTLSPWYPVTPSAATGPIYNLFDLVTTGISTGVGTVGYTAGSSASTRYPTYQTPAIAQLMSFNAAFAINVALTTSGKVATYNLNIRSNGTVIATQQQTFTSTAGTAIPANMVATQGTSGIILGSAIAGSSITLPGPFNITFYTTNATLVYYGQYIIQYDSPVSYGTISIPSGQTVVLSLYQPYTSGTPVGAPVYGITSDSTGLLTSYLASNNKWLSSYTPGSTTTGQLSSILNFNLTTPAQTFPASSVITFELTQSQMTDPGYIASVSPGTLSGNIISSQGSYPYATASLDTSPNGGWYIDAITNTGSFSVITFDANVSQFYQYQQVPYFISGGIAYSSSLYNSPVGSGSYGNINYPFNPLLGDKIIMKDLTGLTQNLDIISASLSGSKLQVLVTPQVYSNWEANVSGSIYQFLMLKRYNDEQNVILSFNKNPGQTSNGFIIPNTINPNVTQNINTLQAAVQSQLLTTQIGVNGTG